MTGCQEDAEDGLTLRGFAGNDRQLSALPRLDHGLVGMELEFAFLLFQPMAAHTLRVHHGSDHRIIDHQIGQRGTGRDGTGGDRLFNEGFDVFEDIAVGHGATEVACDKQGSRGGEERDAVKG